MDAKEKDMKKLILNTIIRLSDLWFVMLLLTCIFSQAYVKTYNDFPLILLIFSILFGGLSLVSSSVEKIN
jgi:ABC-type amino acid transport system permease subunit